MEKWPLEMVCEIMNYLEFDHLLNFSRTFKLFRDVADQYFDRQKNGCLGKKTQESNRNPS
jgi:hypothetical protein